MKQKTTKEEFKTILLQHHLGFVPNSDLISVCLLVLSENLDSETYSKVYAKVQEQTKEITQSLLDCIKFD